MENERARSELKRIEKSGDRQQKKRGSEREGKNRELELKVNEMNE